MEQKLMDARHVTMIHPVPARAPLSIDIGSRCDGTPVLQPPLVGYPPCYKVTLYVIERATVVVVEAPSLDDDGPWEQGHAGWQRL